MCLVSFWIVRIVVSSSAEKALGTRLDDHETSPRGTGTKNAKLRLKHSRNESFLICPIFDWNFKLEMGKSLNFIYFNVFFFMIRGDLSRSAPDWRSELIRSDFCTCLIEIAVKAKSVLLLGDQIPFMVQTIHRHAVTYSSFSKTHRRENGGVT